MSTAVRAFVRFSLFNGHSVLGIRDGIDGLLQDKVPSKLLSNDQRECRRVTFSKAKTLLLDFLKVLIFLFLVDFAILKDFSYLFGAKFIGDVMTIDLGEWVIFDATPYTAYVKHFFPREVTIHNMIQIHLGETSQTVVFEWDDVIHHNATGITHADALWGTGRPCSSRKTSRDWLGK